MSNLNPIGVDSSTKQYKVYTSADSILSPATGLATSSSIVSISGSAAPSAGQVLVAQSASVATWSSAGSALMSDIVYDFSSATRLEDGSGGGTVTIAEYGARFSTTATGNRYFSFRYALDGTGTAPNFNIFAKDSECTYVARNQLQGSDYDLYFGLGFPTAAGGGITYSSVKSLGFKINRVSSGAITISATNCNGSTETATDVTGSYDTNMVHVFQTKYTVGTNAKFYIDGDLVATHTTNLPTTTATDVMASFMGSNRNVASESRLLMTSFVAKRAMT